MGRSEAVEAIILKVHDVGEADRFCILFTKEKGKIAARARSVRKLTSKIGGSLLPTHHVSLQLHTGSAGYMIIDARRIDDTNDQPIESFLNVQQGMELLLSVLHDEQPLPELFDVTLQFLKACATSKTHTVLPFTIKLLSLMGLLPSIDDQYFDRFSENQKVFVRLSIDRDWESLPELNAKERSVFSECCADLLSEIISMPLKAGAVIGEMRGS